MVIRRDITIKYRQSIMGVFWAVLMPMLVVLGGIVVKSAYATLANEPLRLSDVVNVAAKSIPWAFLVSSIRFACMSLVGNSNLVTKIYFPKEIFPIAAVASQLVDLGVASAILAVLLAVTGVSVTPQLLWIPLLIGILVLLSTGVSLLVAACSLFFRDVKYIVEVLLTFGIFFTPVFYDVERFGSKRPLLLLNPVASILEGLVAAIRGQNPQVAWVGYSLAVSMSIAVAGYVLFKQLEPAFAESI